MEQYVLELKKITKRYPGVTALDQVSLGLKKGEVHALMGENGAGKSTMIKVISGAITPDEGEIVVEGESYTHMTPALSKKLGIEVIYQEFNLIPNLSVAENMFMGERVGGKILADFGQMERRAAEVFERMKIDINPKTLVRDLSVAYMQMVEIAKSIVKNVKILIMDEPTAPLTSDEVDILLELVEKLKQEGVTIVYVSHRMDEIYRVADRLSVFRDGKWISTNPVEEISRHDLVCEMVGREITETYPVRRKCEKETILEVRNLTGKGAKNISFDLKKGEILGLAGLVGAGRTETARMIFGADPIESGSIIMKGKEITIRSPRDAVQNGICLVPEDRKQHGVILSLSIRDNITLPIVKGISKLGIVDRKREDGILKKQKDDLRIKTPSFSQKAGNLSGGNQQKVVLSKWLASDAEVLIFDEPTRGIDVGAKQEIYFLMNRLVEAGKAIIMISSEMEELIGMSDRIIVLYEGEQKGEIEKEQFSQELIMERASNIMK
ncbi:MAG: sugar ABC transporter ATP-binding protein [Lachnospiraceae bacterium]|nr:sugar ABC transporter ATP-binding protein [Lachnospiraceae bacterium]